MIQLYDISVPIGGYNLRWVNLTAQEAIAKLERLPLAILSDSITGETIIKTTNKIN